MLLAAGVAGPALAGGVTGHASMGTQPIRLDDPRLPDVLSVEYTYRDHEVVDYQNYSLDIMPRVRFRGPRFDPREAAQGGFFTALGSAHTLGVLSPSTYTDMLAHELGMPGWNVGVGGISASFYNYHPAIIEKANRGAFAIVQITAARMESNDRFQSTPAAQVVLDRKHGDMVAPELAWARIAEEEPENMARYVKQSRQSWEREQRKLMSALSVPVVLLWFSARPMAAGGDALTQVGTTATTAFPQYINGTDVARISDGAHSLVECVTARNAGHPLVSRFTGERVKVNHRLLGAPRVGEADFFEDVNSYYPSLEMHEDVVSALLPTLQQWKPAASRVPGA